MKLLFYSLAVILFLLDHVLPTGAAKAVILNEGDFITLRTDVPDIQRYDEIRWRFGQQTSPDEINRMAGIFNPYDGPDEIQLDHQTGFLTIHKSFNVTVSGDMTSVSVKERESVTLQINVTETQSDDLIVWMFGNFTLAEFNETEQRFYTYNGPDKRFKGRLDLDHQTGSLTIMNINPTHAGEYKLKIISSRHIINRRINVTVSGSGLQSAIPGSGLFPGVVAGIFVVVLLAAAVVTGVVVYRRCKISERQSV